MLSQDFEIQMDQRTAVHTKRHSCKSMKSTKKEVEEVLSVYDVCQGIYGQQ